MEIFLHKLFFSLPLSLYLRNLFFNFSYRDRKIDISQKVKPYKEEEKLCSLPLLMFLEYVGRISLGFKFARAKEFRVFNGSLFRGIENNSLAFSTAFSEL